MVTVAGTAAAEGSELKRVTTKPPVGAGPLIVTVPFTGDVELPLTLEGDAVINTSVGGLSVRLACCELLSQVAVTVASVMDPTAFVVIVNFPVKDFSATLTLAGTVTDLESAASLTTIAPLLAPGSAFKVTSPEVLAPPVMLAGEIDRETTANGFTVRVAVWVTPPKEAVIVVVSVAVTNKWVTANVMLPEPSATLTDAGTVAAFVFELVSFTVSAAVVMPLNVTVPVTVLFDPPTTELGATETD